MTNPKKQSNPHIMHRRYVSQTAEDVVSHGSGFVNPSACQDKKNEHSPAITGIDINTDTQRLIMNAALDAIICISTDGNITFWNPQAEVIFGWTQEDTIGKKLSSLIIPGQYRKRHDEGIINYLKTGKGPAINKLLELSALKKNGEEFPIELTIMPITEEGNTFFCAFIRDITEKKLVEKKLRQSEARLMEAQEVAKVGSWETDLLTLKVIWSDETYRIFELDACEFETSHPGFLEFVHPDDREKVNTAFVNSLTGNAVNTVEHRILTKSGHTKFVMERWKIYHDEQKQPIRAAGTCQDITEQKNAETRITESELKYRTLIEQATDGICIADASMRIIDINPSGYHLLGYSKEEFFNLTIVDLFVPEDLVANPFKLDELKTGKAVTNERRLKRKDGTLIEVELNAKLLEDGRFMLFARDISKRKQADKALQAAYEEKNTILESIGDAFFAIDKNWIVTYWNKEAEIKLHTPKNKILGNHLWEVFSDSIDSVSYKKYHEAIDTNQVVNFEDYYDTLDRWYEISAYPSPTGLSVYFKDITEHKKSKHALQKAYDEKNTILESIDDGFFAVDNNSLVTYWNRKAEILLGVSREDVIGKNLHEMFASPDSLEFYNNYQKAISENTTVHFEAFSKRSNKWFAVSAFASQNGLSVYFKDVSDRIAFTGKILESEVRYRTLIEQASDTICIADAGLKFIEVNPSGCQMFGYTKKEFLELHITDVLFPQDLEINPIQFSELKAGKTTSNERRIKRKDGTAIEIELNAKMLGDGKILMFGRDITARKESERLLKESEAKYRSFFESSMDGILLTVTDGEILSANPAACDIFKMTEDEICAAGRFGLVDLTDPRLHTLLEERQRSGSAKGELTLLRKNGNKFEVEITSAVFTDSYGRERTSMIIRDVSERKQAEDKLKESENKYRTFFEQNMAGVYQSTEKGVILNCNNAFAKMLKYDSPDELLKINASELYFSPAERNNLCSKAITQNKIHNYESVLKCKDGSHLYFIEYVSIRKDDVTGEALFNGIMIDITEKKQAEFQLKKSNERYNLISQATNDMVWDWNLLTGNVFRNKEGWRKIFRTGENKIGKAITDAWDSRIHPEDKERVKLINDGIYTSTHNSFEIECRVLRDDGTYAYIHDRGNIIRDEHGKPVRVIGASQDITQRKEAELQVAKSEFRFRSLVQNSSELICIFDDRGYFKYSSPAIKKILGFEPEYTIEKNAFAFLHPDDVDPLKDYLLQMKPDLQREMPLLRFKNTGGEWKWIESKVTNMTDNPEVAGYVFNCRDVTERKIAEAEIEKLSFIARETSNAVIITNPEGEIIWVNEGFTQITEFEFEEVIGKKPGDFLQGDETNLAVVRYMRNKLKKIEPFECDILNYSKFGRKYWLRIQAQPQFDETGKLKYFFAIETDITKEKEAEEILKASEERYRYLFNNNPACISIWDIDTLKILEVNNTAIELYGYTRQEFLDKTILDFGPEKYRGKLRQFAIEACKTDFRSENICKHYNNSGEEMYMNISSHCIQFRGRNVILALASNITDNIILEKALEKERLAKQQEITQAVISAQEQERQEIGGELHDNINQILAGSLLYLGLAKREMQIEHPYLKETDILINSAIVEIRNLSHSLIPPSLHESELVGAINNIIEVTEKTSGLNIKLHTYDFDESAIPDKLKLNIYRIIQEQFTNILKHAGAKNILVRLVQDNEKTMLSIKDDGIGFDTSKKANGVGLMNIKTRASLFNGELNIITSPGHGCELRVLFN